MGEFEGLEVGVKGMAEEDGRWGEKIEEASLYVGERGRYWGESGGADAGVAG